MKFMIPLLGLLISVLWFYFWISMIINAAKNNRYIWLVLIILFPLSALLYRMIGYVDPYQGHIPDRFGQNKRLQE